MQSNRDSSVLRSLAVAFGDGLAFGVGMKLTQKGVRSLEGPAPDPEPPLDLSPLLERLDAIERRVGEVERAPAPIAEAPASSATSSAAPAPFDQKVLAAIVNALDARLAEQAGQVERRLGELEAKLALELKSLQQQDRAVVHSVETHIKELNGQFNDQLAAIRRRSDEERAAMQKEIASLHREFGLEAAQAMAENVAGLRKELALRDSQIAELRARLDTGDEGLRNVVVAIGQACQTVAAKPVAVVKSEPESRLESKPAPSVEWSLPGLAQPKPGPRTLPNPLISSLA